jgi:hypothetical protein
MTEEELADASAAAVARRSCASSGRRSSRRAQILRSCSRPRRARAHRRIAPRQAQTHRPAAAADGWTEPAATRIPGTLPAMYAVMARSVAARQRVGTVAVTAVGMFAGGGGFGITPLSLMFLEVIAGGMSQRPRIVDGQVTVRDVLDLT